VTNWDGNRLRGVNFYAFPGSGTVKFISVDARTRRSIYQDGAAQLT